jgi:hypothetical protein
LSHFGPEVATVAFHGAVTCDLDTSPAFSHVSLSDVIVTVLDSVCYW